MRFNPVGLAYDMHVFAWYKSIGAYRPRHDGGAYSLALMWIGKRSDAQLCQVMESNNRAEGTKR